MGGQIPHVGDNDFLSIGASNIVGKLYPKSFRFLMRASRVENLNDSTEMKHGLQILGALLRKRSEWSSLREVFEEFSEKVEKVSLFDSIRSNSFVISFSNAANDLNQWRIYSNGGSGLSIGFDVSVLAELYGSHVWSSFTSVLYDGRSLKAAIERDIEAIFLANQQRDEWPWKKPTETLEKLEGPMGRLLEALYLVRIMVSTKNEAFASENEVRLYFSPIALDYAAQIKQNQNSYSDYFKNYVDLGTSSLVVNDSLRFFREIPFPLEAVKEIWIGPKSKATVEDISRLLSGWEYGKVQVRKSELPLV